MDLHPKLMLVIHSISQPRVDYVAVKMPDRPMANKAACCINKAQTTMLLKQLSRLKAKHATV